MRDKAHVSVMTRGHVGGQSFCPESEACVKSESEEEEEDVAAQLVHASELKSKFNGVCWHKMTRKWFAYVKVNEVQVTLGYFTDEAAAAAAFDKAVLLVRGRETVLNFPLSNYLDADGAIIEDCGIKKRLQKRG